MWWPLRKRRGLFISSQEGDPRRTEIRRSVTSQCNTQLNVVEDYLSFTDFCSFLRITNGTTKREVPGRVHSEEGYDIHSSTWQGFLGNLDEHPCRFPSFSRSLPPSSLTAHAHVQRPWSSPTMWPQCFTFLIFWQKHQSEVIFFFF